MTLPEKLAKFNLVLTGVWLVLSAPSLLWWSTSILWVIVISLWANIVGHFSAYLAGRAEIAQATGYNLTPKDKEWLIDQMNQMGETEVNQAPQYGTSAHVYFSTSCYHDNHSYCKNESGAMGTKVPGKCKFCDAKCRCWCHAGPERPSELREDEQMELF